MILVDLVATNFQKSSPDISHSTSTEFETGINLNRGQKGKSEKYVFKICFPAWFPKTLEKCERKHKAETTHTHEVENVAKPR